MKPTEIMSKVGEVVAFVWWFWFFAVACGVNF